MNYFEQLKKDGEAKGSPPPKTARLPKRQVVQDIAPPEARPSELKPRRTQPAPRAPSQPIPAAESRTSAEAPPISSPVALTPALSEPEIAVRTWEPESARRGRLKRRLIFITALIVLALVVILPTVVFPTVSIAIIPKVETTAVPATEFLANTAAVEQKIDQRVLPAIEVTSEKTITREYGSSGTKVFQERAHGAILLYNAYSSAPQSLVANTRLQDPTGKIFRLRSAVTIPGARINEGKIVPTTISAEVIADAPGEASNIGSGEFRIPGFRGTPKYDGFYARSETTFTGGFTGEARVVEAADIQRASEELTRDAIAALERELSSKVPDDPDFISPAGARELAVVRIDAPKAGERRDAFNVSVTARGRMFAVRRSHVSENLASILLRTQEGKETVAIAPRQPGLEMRGVQLGPRPGEAHIVASGELAYWQEADRGAIAAVLAASTPRKAEAYLRGRDEIGSFRIKRFPVWLWFIPGRPGGLEINFTAPD